MRRDQYFDPMPLPPGDAGSRSPDERGSSVFHAQSRDAKNHVVGISRLAVVVYQSDGAWFAQGIEIDYLAEGSSIDDVTRAFEDGLAATVDANLRRFQSLEPLLRATPVEVVARVLQRGVRRFYSQVTAHSFPFAVEYLEAVAA